MAHHGDARVDDRLRALDRRAAALELHRVGAAFLHEPHRVARPPARSTTSYEPNGMSATTIGRFAPRVTHCVMNRISSSETGTVDSRPCSDHAGRVADEDQVDAGSVGEPPARRVVRGDHHDLLAAALHLHQLRQRQLAGRPRRVARRLVAHVSSPSRMTLSMSRVAPTRDGGRENRRAVEIDRARRSRVSVRSARARVAATASPPSAYASRLRRARAGARVPGRAPRRRVARCATRARARPSSRTVGSTRISHVEVQVAHDAADDDRLLRVLLAEVRARAGGRC